MTEHPLPYRLPLTGISLIEASAGTGKTHTLIRLIARHVLWHNKAIDQVLAVTFTKAATAELRSRLRAYLQELDQYIVEQNKHDADLEHMIFDRPAELELTTLILRLKLALASIDKAAIYTIHGFCQRILNEHPLLAGQSIQSPTFSDDTQDLREQICQEFWRQQGQHPYFAEALANTWADPNAMLKITSDLLSTAILVPERPSLLAAPDFNRAVAQLNDAFQIHQQQAKQILLLAMQNKILSGVSHKPEKTNQQFLALQHFLAAPTQHASLELNQLASSQFKLNSNKLAPVNPLFNAVDEWLVFTDSMAAYQDSLSICLHHDFRAYLQTRLAELKLQRNQISSDDFIERLLNALQAPQGPALAQAIRTAYPVALVDEFQDTDDKQWAIFKALYSNQPNTSLTLIGDPKQAIYAFRGGDIHTYLNARESAQQRETLLGNYRSDADLLDAIQRLFTGKHAHPFYEPGIAFVPLSAEKTPGKVCIAGNTLPALQFLNIAAQDDGKPQNIGAASLQCAQQCANQIAWLSQEIQAGNALVKSEQSSRALTHHDIVVLVSTHQQAKLMQRHLYAVSVPSVCVDKSSVFDSYEALDIKNILSYLQAPSSLRHQQNAQHGILLQCVPAESFDLAQQLELLSKQGLLGCFSPLLQRAETTIMALHDGERRLSNYWQIVELIQNQCSHTCDLPKLLDWFSRQLEHIEFDTEDAGSITPRLESGAPRIRIITLHQSKGLEFGVVFMPFSVISKNKAAKLQRYFNGTQRCLYYAKNPASAELAEKIRLEQDSENLRLLYVGVTRAVHALFLSWGHVKNNSQCALQRVLADDKNACSEADIIEQIQRFDVAPMRTIKPPSLQTENTEVSAAFLKPSRQFADFWRISSFSGLHQSKENTYPAPASDELQPFTELDTSPYKGAAFGNAMHYVLEHANAADWQTNVINELNNAAKQLAYSALVQFGYDTKSAENGIFALCTLAHNTLHGLLPEGISLHQLPAEEMRHEMEFHLRVKHARSAEVLAILHQHGYCLARKQLGFLPQLHGLLTGKIDLLFCHQQRFYIVDYKSNLLDDYAQSALQESIKAQEYDLQYVLYSLALHRFLSHKLAAGYDYEKHIGGVRYLYARGMQAHASSGIFCDRPPFSMIKQLDLCFDAGRGERYVA